MGEFQEFTEALFGQLSVEIDEEKEIIKLASTAKEDLKGKAEFNSLENIATEIFSTYKNKVEEFLQYIKQNKNSIALVGNGDIKEAKGDEIDNHNVVIRFNNFYCVLTIRTRSCLIPTLL